MKIENIDDFINFSKSNPNGFSCYEGTYYRNTAMGCCDISYIIEDSNNIIGSLESLNLIERYNAISAHRWLVYPCINTDILYNKLIKIKELLKNLIILLKNQKFESVNSLINYINSNSSYKCLRQEKLLLFFLNDDFICSYKYNLSEFLRNDKFVKKIILIYGSLYMNIPNHVPFYDFNEVESEITQIYDSLKGEK